MAVSRIKTWAVGEVLTASDLNAELDNQNRTGVAFPLTENVSCAGYEVSNAKLTTLKQLNDNVVSIDNYADFATAISSIGSTVTTLLINKNVNVTANATVPSTLTLWFMGQGKLTITAATTTTINGPVVADDRQIFAGSGTVTGLTGTLAVSPYWWGTVSSSTLNLYVATTGSDSNDGMTVGAPLATIQAAGDKIYTFAYANLTYKINIAAGTYVEAATFSKPFPTPQRVQFLGAPVANGTEPTTIMDSPGGGAKIGLYFQARHFLWVEDIKFTDYYTSGSPSSSGLSYGLFAGDHSDLYTKNVWTTNCDNGIGVWHLGKGRIEAGIHRDNGNGVVGLSNCVMTVGYGGTVADITGTTGVAFIDCITGVNFRENVAGHVDYCYFSGITNMALYISQQSRCNNVSSTYDTCNIGVRAETNAYWYENPGDENTFTGNTTDLLIRSGSLTGGTNAGADWYGPALLDNDTAFYATSSLTNVLIYTHTFFAKELGTRGRGFRLTLWGDVTGTAGTKTVTIALGATTLLTATIAATTTDYKIVVDLVQRTSTGSPAQRVLTEIYETGVLPVLNYTSTAIDMAADIDLTVNHNVTNGADSNRIQNMRLEIVH